MDLSGFKQQGRNSLGSPVTFPISFAIMSPMFNFDRELASARTEIERIAGENEHALALWRERMYEQIEKLEKQERDRSDERDGAVEKESPEYEALQQQMSAGGLRWIDIFSSETNDPDARDVRAQLAPILAASRQAFELTERGVAINEALETAFSEHWE
ncbi:hypothetical protein GCM10010411_23850 [Actinomadura fulvescens]|uniref:Uncharacterized protein n=2 Tax=Actinomadura fulvescens TaxID=46160 RepID=A0ABP6BYU7_9ACTN